MIRALGLAHAGRLECHSDNVEEHKTRRQGIEAAIERLDQITSERNLSENIVQLLRARHRGRLKHIEHRSDGNDGHRKLTERHDDRRRIELELDLREVDLANQWTEQ